MEKFEKEYRDETGLDASTFYAQNTYTDNYIQWLEQRLVKLLDLHNVSGWLPIPEGSDDDDRYDKATDNNCLIRFNNGHECRFYDKWPWAKPTHYKIG